MREIAAAVAFLTRLPVPGAAGFAARDVAGGTGWFPAVGAAIGALAWLAMLALAPLLPPSVAATLVVILQVRVTGALHLDGLADTADGFGGGDTREDILRIMKDHRIGAYGAAAVAFALFLKIAALTALIERRSAGPCLVLAAALGRWPAVLLMWALPYARRTGEEAGRSGGAVSEFVGMKDLALATTLTLPLIALAPLRGAACWAGVAGLAAASARWFRRRIGGVTGDTLGAVIEASETAVLVLALALESRSS